MEEKKIFNQDSEEKFTDAKMIGGNPNGIINFNRTPHSWAYTLYKKMLARTWFAEQVNVSKDKINYSKLSPEAKRSYDLVLAQLITNDSIQTNQLMDKMNSFVTSPVVNACLSRQAYEECLVEETEILTSRGFIDFKDLKKDELVANFTNRGKIEFTELQSKRKYDYEGELIRIYDGNGYEQIVTPNHRVVRKDKKGKYFTTFAKDLVLNDEWNECSFPLTGNVKSFNNKANDVDLRLAVLFIKHGINKEKYDAKRWYYTFSFDLSLKNEKRNLQLLTEIIEEESLIYDTTDLVNTNRRYKKRLVTILHNDDFDKNLDWVKLEKVSNKFVLDVINHIKLFDTSKNLHKVKIECDTRESLNKLQAIMTLGGYKTTVELNKSNYYVLNIHLKTLEEIKGKKMDMDIITYSGRVYCATVPSGMIICRYNDYVFVTGNSQHSQSYAVMAEDIAQDTDRIYDMHHHDEELKLKNYAVQNMYDNVYKEGTEITKEDLLTAFAANQILEGLVFPGGFVIMFSLEHTLPGSSEMVKEIAKDKYVPLHSNM